jgi:hypothetical protein
MKKFSERAVEIMVERYKKLPGPSSGYANYHEYMQRTAALEYPSVRYLDASDVALALDEQQSGRLW